MFLGVHLHPAAPGQEGQEGEDGDESDDEDQGAVHLLYLNARQD